MVFKLAAIIGGVLLMAGVAFAGTMTSLGSTESPELGTTPPSSHVHGAHRTTTGRRTSCAGVENEPRSRTGARRPCDEPEHANGLRCTGVAARQNQATDRRGRDDSQQRFRRPPSSVTATHGGGHDDYSGHGNDD